MCHPSWTRALNEAHRLGELARLRRVRDRIDREYARPLDVEALARDAGLPAGQLARRFLLAYGRTPYAYLMARRVERAVALLGAAGRDPAEVCAAVGGPCPAAFHRRFAQIVGTPPGAYRRAAAGG
ncbi:AraC family transcriptional regulator [Actinomadura sp. ATCC 31491]|uniref:AraC family transcriptional regulator n=1 Tax=Actinomadura luzonensis TaxID=2805427 RepID=A0ABT0FM15_9ACTN|nr:AraC family transcriptional regulator [Actinomadura luzonensis]MCK2213284.1 AraC family transcriptional regulator [Actinomadura luzonensis]